MLEGWRLEPREREMILSLYVKAVGEAVTSVFGWSIHNEQKTKDGKQEIWTEDLATWELPVFYLWQKWTVLCL